MKVKIKKEKTAGVSRVSVSDSIIIDHTLHPNSRVPFSHLRVFVAWKVIQVILERKLEMCDQPMDTVRPRCTRVKPGKGVHSGNYYKLPQIGRMGAIEELS